ncbi:MAG TPA: SAM-dependent methyltransferase [Polyangiaceae bacterium]|nr:SAM-dependent methyltransferase [Polyangiaceae bacterium]
MHFRRSLGTLAFGVGLFAVGCGGSQGNAAAPTPPAPSASPAPASSASATRRSAPPDTARYQSFVDAPDRDPEDKKLDAGRHPAELLAFFGIEPGMRVAELGAGGGYTTELLARAVGETGTVYGQNSELILSRFAEKPWSARLQKPVMKHVVRLDRPFDDPFPPEVKDLDAVVVILFYHDTVWQKVDRDRMNRAVFAALRSGGTYDIVDHSGRPGTGETETETLHRIEEPALRAEVEKAGFVLSAEGSFLRNPEDPRDWNASPRVAGEKRGTSDRFVLVYEKP